LNALFGKFGAVRSVDFKTTFAFVEFREQAQATAALEALNKSDLKGHTLVVEYMLSKTSARYVMSVNLSVALFSLFLVVLQQQH
jgi:RNA recognition motif-containing protein